MRIQNIKINDKYRLECLKKYFEKYGRKDSNGNICCVSGSRIIYSSGDYTGCYSLPRNGSSRKENIIYDIIGVSAFRCPHCGFEVTGIDRQKEFLISEESEYGDEFIKIFHEEKNRYEEYYYKCYDKRLLEDLTYYDDKCPVCDKCTDEDRDLFYKSIWEDDTLFNKFDTDDIDEGAYFDKIFNRLKTKVNKKAEIKKAQKEIDKIKNVTVENQITITKDLNSNEIKQFLLHIIQVYSNTDILSKRLEELYILLGESHLKRENDCLDELSRIGWELLKLSQEKTPSFNMEKPVFSLREPYKPTEPLYRKPSIFNRKRVEKENEALKNSYFTRLQKYNLEFDHYQKQLDAHNKRMSEYNEKLRLFNEEVTQKKAEAENGLKSFRENLDKKKAEISGTTLAENQISNLISDEIEQTKKLLKESYSCLYSLYNCGILYGKYCNIVAVSSFYDYFMSGRCSTLDGTNGAYNLFESESRADKILLKLDVIIEELEQIKENQYTLYLKLNEINSNINKLNATAGDMLTALRSVKESSSKLVESAEYIAYNTAVNAYYSKINAELTNSLGFLIALK